MIGEVTDSGVLRVFHGDETVGEIPARFLTEDAPRYEIPQAPRELDPPAPPPQEVPETEQVLLDLLGSDNIRSRRWIYERYDHIVGSRTVRRPGLDGALLRLRPSLRGLAVSLDATGRQGRLDPRFGGAAAVFEAARNVACAGGEPLAVTDCLNYGNPEKPEIAWELAQGIEGIRDACLALGIPVVSGNVSLYNETGGRPIYPTPSVGCVGLVQDVRHAPAAWREGDAILLAGAPLLGFDGSEYQALYDRLRGCPPELDLAGRGGARRLPLAQRRAPQPRARHLDRRPRRRARAGGALLRDRRRARRRGRPPRALRRGRRPRRRRVRPVRGRTLSSA